MVTETTYIAFDGKRFKTRWECEEYEKNLRLKGLDGTLLCFRVDGEPIPLKNEEDIISYVTYVVIKSKEAYNYLCEIIEDSLPVVPSESVVKANNYHIAFEYDEKEEYWVQCKAIIEHLKTEIQSLQKYVDMAK